MFSPGWRDSSWPNPARSGWTWARIEPAAAIRIKSAALFVITEPLAGMAALPYTSCEIIRQSALKASAHFHKYGVLDDETR